jgi:hypothetical protein
MAAAEYYGTRFDTKRTATGWCVVVTCPNGVHIEFHDFQSQAGAKAWIAAYARQWAMNYMKPSEY